MILAPTHCLICGRPLTDVDSVNRGIGPECSGEGYPTELEPNHAQATHAIYEAALASSLCNIAKVRELAELVKNLGYPLAAERMLKRFQNAEKNAKIIITAIGDSLLVKTPFRRGDAKAFIDAWRAIKGRRFDPKTKGNFVPVTERPALMRLLTRFFPGEYGNGPKGIFRLPTATEQ